MDEGFAAGYGDALQCLTIRLQVEAEFLGRYGFGFELGNEFGVADVADFEAVGRVGFEYKIDQAALVTHRHLEWGRGVAAEQFHGSADQGGLVFIQNL